MVKRNMKLAVLLLTFLLATAFASVAGAEPAKENIPAWVKEEVGIWKSLGLLKGDQNGNVLPGNAAWKLALYSLYLIGWDAISRLSRNKMSIGRYEHYRQKKIALKAIFFFPARLA